jgi:uncharacterized protein YqgC (DUF456 family)
MTPITALAVALLVAGVVGSLRTRIPGAVLSLAGVYLYWWETGFTEPEWVTLALLTAVGVLALVGSLFGTFVADRIEGASTVVAAIGIAVGVVAFPFLGTTGLLVGTAATVFVLEYVRRRDMRRSFVAALSVVLGSVASSVMQFLLTGAMLAVMVLVVV